MQLSVYVSAKCSFYAKVLFVFASLATILSCATFPSKEKKEDAEKLLESQLSIVVNYLEKGVPQRAHVELRKLIADHPKNPKVLNLMGLTNLAFKKPSIAEPYFRQAYEIEPDPRYTLNISSAYIEARKYAKAIATLKGQLKKGLGEYPFPERFQHNLGVAYEEANKKPTAKKYFLKALDINPAHYPTLVQIAKLSAKMGKASESENYYRQAKDACINCYEPVKALVALHTKRNEQALAQGLLKEFLQRKNLLNHDRIEANKILSKLDPEAGKTK